MGQASIGYISTQNRNYRNLKKSTTARHNCCLCYKVFAIKEPGLYIFKVEGEQDIKFCYHHILEMVKKHDTYFPNVMLSMEGFDLCEFLRLTRENLLNKSPNSSKTKRTIRLVREFLNNTKLMPHVIDPTEYTRNQLCLLKK